MSMMTATWWKKEEHVTQDAAPVAPPDTKDDPYRSMPVPTEPQQPHWALRNPVIQTLLGAAVIALLLAVVVGIGWLLFPGVCHLGNWIAIHVGAKPSIGNFDRWMTGAEAILILALSIAAVVCVLNFCHNIGKTILTILS